MTSDGSEQVREVAARDPDALIRGKQGRAFKVQINDGGKEKTVIVRPAHLRAQQ